MTTQDEKIETIACQLRLLFAGMSTEQIARVVIHASALDDACNVFWYMRYLLPVGVPYGTDQFILHEHIADNLAEDDELVASTRDLDYYMAYFDNIDVGDQAVDTVYNVIDELRRVGMIRSKATTPGGDVK